MLIYNLANHSHSDRAPLYRKNKHLSQNSQILSFRWKLQLLQDKTREMIFCEVSKIHKSILKIYFLNVLISILSRFCFKFQIVGHLVIAQYQNDVWYNIDQCVGYDKKMFYYKLRCRINIYVYIKKKQQQNQYLHWNLMLVKSYPQFPSIKACRATCPCWHLPNLAASTLMIQKTLWVWMCRLWHQQQKISSPF